MSSLAEFFTALGKYDFLQSALITAIMVGIMSGLIGSFIILRGMSLMGDAISHAVLPGVGVLCARIHFDFDGRKRYELASYSVW